MANSPATSGLRVLVVVHDPDEASGLSRLLESWGHEVHFAATGQAGVEEAEQWRPNVILMDLRLPGALDGLAVARILRRKAETSTASFIGFVEPSPSVDLSLEQSAFDGILTKPIAPTALQELLARLVKPA
jgi:CheY-like chemotaxis protein